jgi:hypothetical protein
MITAARIIGTQLARIARQVLGARRHLPVVGRLRSLDRAFDASGPGVVAGQREIPVAVELLGE